MSFPRRNFIVAAVFGGVALLSGCMTNKLWSENFYSEKVSHILVSNDGSKLVVVTGGYHYIFDAPAGVVKTLNGEFHSSVSADFYDFRLDSSGKITGVINLILDKNAPVVYKNDAIGAGYGELRGRLTLVGKIDGVRYRSGGLEIPKDIRRLNKEYIIKISADRSVGDTAVKTLMTPLTLAADGVSVVWGAAGLTLIFVPLLIADALGAK